jgi:hypothetical protein
LLSRRLDGLDERRVLIALGRIIAASVVMGAASYGAILWLAQAVPSAEWYWRAVRVSLAIGAGLIVLAVSARAFGISEFNDASDRVIRRLVRR